MWWKVLLSAWLVSVAMSGAKAQAGGGSGPPVGLWPLTWQYGAQDVTGNGNDGVPVGTGLASGPFGDDEGAFEFSGTDNSYIDIPNNGKLDTRYSYTILAHIYPTGDQGPLFDYIPVPYSNWAVHLWQTGPQRLFMRASGRNGYTAPYVRADVLQPGAWNYVAGTYDYSTGVEAVWNEAVLVDQLDIGIHEVSTQYPVRVASRRGDTRHYRGRIACIQLYDYAMTQDQIEAARYNDWCMPVREVETTTSNSGTQTPRLLVDGPPPPLPPPCIIRIWWVLDVSWSMSISEFLRILQFILEFLLCFDGVDVQIGIITFDCLPTLEVRMGEFSLDDPGLTDAVNGLQRRGGSTRTGLALHYVKCMSDIPEDVWSVVILVTDGTEANGQGTDDYEAQAAMLRASGMELYAVAAGYPFLLNTAALGTITGNPDRVVDPTDPCALADRIIEECCGEI